MSETIKKSPFDTFAIIVLAIGLLARLFVMATVFHDDDAHADDAYSYIAVAYKPSFLGVAWNSEFGGVSTSFAPMYPIYLIPFFNANWSDNESWYPYSRLPRFSEDQFYAARMGHVLLDMITLTAVYLLASLIFDLRVGRVAVAAQALDPRAMFAIGPIATEPLFLTLLTVSLLVFVIAEQRNSIGLFVLSGLFMGLSVMTRPVPLLFPVVLGVLFVLRSKHRALALKVAGGLVAVLLLIIIPWNIRTGLGRGQFLLPVSDSAYYHLWATTVEGEYSLGNQNQINEAHLAEFGKTDRIMPEDYLQAAVRRIRANPFAWLNNIFDDTVRAFIEPYGANIAVTPGGPGLLTSWRNLLTGQLSLAEFLAIENILRRTLMYLWQGWGLLFGTIGIVLAIVKRVPQSYVIVAWIVYATLVTSALLIEPRYVYVIMFAFTVLAAYASVYVWDVISKLSRRQVTKDAAVV